MKLSIHIESAGADFVNRLLGRLRHDLPDDVEVVCEAKLSETTNPNTIARTGEFLHFAPGAPG